MIKVSVCMPNYNYGEFLEQAILSVFNQDYKNIELIVVDDNSTDNSLSIMHHYKKISPIPMQIIQGGHIKGVAAAMNLAINASSGSWLAIFHSDDFSCNSRISKQVNSIKKGDVIIHSGFINIDRKGIKDNSDSSFELAPCEGRSLRDLLLYKRDVRSPTIMFAKNELLECGGLNENLPVEDWQLILKLASKGSISYVNENLVYRRVHSKNLSLRSSKKITKFSFNDIALEVLEKLIPLDMNKEKIITIHSCNILRNTIATGNWGKSLDCIKKTSKKCPRYRYLIFFAIIKSLPSYIWLNFAKIYMPRPLVKLIILLKKYFLKFKSFLNK